MGIGGRRWALVAAVAAVAAVPATALAAPQKRTAPRAAPVIGVSAPRPAVEAGARVVLSASVRNTASRSGRVAVAFHASADARRDARDRLLGSARTARLKPGARGTAKLSVRLRSAGTYTLFACVRTGGRTRCAKAPRKLVVRAARPAPTPAPAPKAPTPPAPPAEQPRQNPPAPGPPDPPAGNPALALQVASDVEWSLARQLAGSGAISSGDTITSELRLGAGVPGQAGYDRASVAATAAAGAGTVLLSPTGPAPDGGDFDDGTVRVRLPFAFPFAGVRTAEVAVSTNGWIALAGPAFGGYEGEWSADHRGAERAVGDNVAGIAPLRADLTLDGSGPAGRVVLVRPAGGDSVAIRWEDVEESGSGLRMTFEAVLFRDGRIRFDYPERPGSPGIAGHVIGISPGVAGKAADFVVGGDPLLPAGSVLFTPKPVASAAPAAAGTATLTLPRGSAVVGKDAACTVSRAPTTIAEGLVSCATPAVAAGSGTSATVSWTYPDALWTNPVQAATWTAATATRTTEAELVQGVYRDLAGAPITLTPAAALPLGRAGVEVDTGPPGPGLPALLPLRRPRISGTLPAGLTPVGATSTLGGTTFTRDDLTALCDRLPAPGQGGAVSCALPTGLSIGTRFTLLYDGAPGASYPLTVSLTADNLSRPLTASTSVNVP